MHELWNSCPHNYPNQIMVLNCDLVSPKIRVTFAEELTDNLASNNSSVIHHDD
ncbi:hypothetical protein X777_16774 [Ooceraea biroi]|uniref:Uncharacterized protein n=1 Tax=Ooceraea biroi TaxID=2015173 RepID=A0A026WWX3_OOCBI|nr:hypothetical protein X777_16774 [Ooceraea biroi]